MKRYGMIIKLRSDKVEYYKQLHADVWPDVADMITDCNIRNYTIFLKELVEGEFYLFSFFEYVGEDFAADMEKMAADPTTQKWWEECMPCQEKIETAGDDEWWAEMQEVYHLD